MAGAAQAMERQISLTTTGGGAAARHWASLALLFQTDDSTPDIEFFTDLNADFMTTVDVIKANELFIEDFTDLLPFLNNFWHYEGSMTTPDCRETVNWYVNKKLIRINSK